MSRGREKDSRDRKMKLAERLRRKEARRDQEIVSTNRRNKVTVTIEKRTRNRQSNKDRHDWMKKG